jgi:hypothetical protein
MPDLSWHLTRAWDYSVSPTHGAPIPEDCAAEFSTDELLARRKQLLPVRERCHISRVYLAYIDRVLDVKK